MHFYLIGVGLLLAFGSFIFAAFNMGSFATKFFNDFDEMPPAHRTQRRAIPPRDPTSGFGSMFRRHLGSMVLFMTGSGIAFIGAILWILTVLKSFGVPV